MSVLSPIRPLRRVGLLVGVVVALVCALVVLQPGGGAPRARAADAAESSSGVSLAATGEAIGAPDILRLRLATEQTRPRADTALAAAGAAARRTTAALRWAGVAAADVQTTGLQVNPTYGSKGSVSGYTARQQISAVVRTLARAGATIDSVATAAGSALRVDGLAYEVDDDEALLSAARAKAFALAKSRAESYAAAAGRTLGAVVEVTEGAGGQAQNDLAVPAASSGARSSLFDAASLAPGSLTVSVTVAVRWALG